MSVIQIILTVIYVLLGVAISIVILMQEGKSNGLGSAIGGYGGQLLEQEQGTFYGRRPGAFYPDMGHCVYGYHPDFECSFGAYGIIIRQPAITEDGGRNQHPCTLL